jgi:hypothetical protein
LRITHSDLSASINVANMRDATVMTTDQIDQVKDEDDAAYFQRRAEWHRGRASVADDVATRRLHEKFARMYHDRGAD